MAANKDREYVEEHDDDEYDRSSISVTNKRIVDKQHSNVRSEPRRLFTDFNSSHSHGYHIHGYDHAQNGPRGEGHQKGPERPNPPQQLNPVHAQTVSAPTQKSNQFLANAVEQRSPSSGSGSNLSNVKLLKNTVEDVPVSALMQQYLKRQKKTALVFCKLMSERMEVSFDAVQKNLLAENRNFSVISFIGPANTGKSTMASELFTDTCDGPTRSGHLFSVANQSSIADGRSSTAGIDMCICSDRTIILDCQSLMNVSMFCKLVEKNHFVAFTGNESYDTAENVVEMYSLYLLLFLLRISNTVCFVVDGHFLHSPSGLNMLSIFRTAYSLQNSIPYVFMKPIETGTKDELISIATIGQSAHSISSYVDLIDERPVNCEIIFAFNKLEHAFITHQFTAAAGQFLDLHLGAVAHPQSKNKKGRPERDKDGRNDCVRVVALCDFYDGYTKVPSGKDFKMKNSLYASSLSHFKTTLQNSVSASRTRISTSSSHHLISEMEWIRNTERLWDIIRKSPAVNEFNMVMRQAKLYMHT